MPIDIVELRLALAWSQSYDQETYLSYLSSSSRYAEEFEKAKAGTGEWLLPWTAGDRQHFWQFYLGTAAAGDLDAVDAARAWDHLMPLRAPRAARLITPDDVRISLEGYAFPHGVGVLAMAFIRPQTPLPLAKAAERAIQVREGHFSAEWEGRPKSHGMLDSLAGELIDVMHAKLLGKTPHGKPLSKPLTTATIVDADTAQQTAADQEELEHVLASLCQLSPEPAAEPAMAARFVAIGRGKVIWHPYYYSRGALTRPRVRALGCYHRNLAVASLQTRGLTDLLRRAESFLLQKEPVSGLIVRPVRRAVNLLRDLDAGSWNTYRSWALQAQISFYRELIDRISQAVGTE